MSKDAKNNMVINILTTNYAMFYGTHYTLVAASWKSGELHGYRGVKCDVPRRSTARTLFVQSRKIVRFSLSTSASRNSGTLKESWNFSRTLSVPESYDDPRIAYDLQ